MQNKILIEGLRLYAHHGVLPQERKIGAYFTLDLDITTDFTEAMQTDQLKGTISYADILQTVRREMSIPSQLLEHAAGRIAQAILAEYPSALAVRIKMLKENPPMGADLRGAGVEIIINQ